MSEPLRPASDRPVVNFVPEHIDVCSTCGYGAVKENYPCYRCGQLGITRFVPQQPGPEHWLVTRPGYMGPIAITERDAAEDYARRGWKVEGPFGG